MNFDLNAQIPADSPDYAFYVNRAPFHAARGRAGDILICHLYFSGRASAKQKSPAEMLKKLAPVYFRTPGSITSGIRAVTEAIHQACQAQNHSLVTRESSRLGHLFLAVLRNDILLLQQSGLAPSLLKGSWGEKAFFDLDLLGSGLGSALLPSSRFFQAKVQSGDRLLISPALLASPRRPLPLQSQNLQNSASAWTVEFTPGKGRVVSSVQTQSAPNLSELVMPYLSISPVTSVSSLPTPDNHATEKTRVMIVRSPSSSANPDSYPKIGEADSRTPYAPHDQATFAPRDVSRTFATSTEATHQVQAPAFDSVESSVPEDSIYDTDEDEAPYEEDFSEELSTEGISTQSEEKPRLGERILRGIAYLSGSLRRFERKAESGLTRRGDLISRQVMGLIAVIVPITLALLAAVIYTRGGQQHQYNYYLSQAQASANNAPLMPTVNDRRIAWEQTLDWISQAREIKNSPEADAIERQALNALDAIEGGERLLFKPAFPMGSFPNAFFSRIISLGSDLYLLDKNEGQILHLNLSSQGYQLDNEFYCGPGKYINGEVGKLVDMTTVPIINPARAPLLAVDAQGNLLYCGAGLQANADSLPEPPGGWHNLRSIYYNETRLFVLDPAANTLWIYRGYDRDVQFKRPADSYFEDEPVRLLHATNVIVNSDELMLLHSDGHTSHCLASNVTGKLDCSDPWLYQDEREGVETIDFATLGFSEMALTAPPASSLVFLDASRAELYQFTLNLKLNRILRAGSSSKLPTKEATAMGFSEKRMVFLAFGNEVFYAMLP